jgi:hypothetical protein
VGLSSLAQTRQRVGLLLLDRIGSAHLDRDVSWDLLISGEPYRREGPIAEFVNDAVTLVEAIADLDGMESFWSIMLKSLHVLDHLVKKWRSRHGC